MRNSIVSASICLGVLLSIAAIEAKAQSVADLKAKNKTTIAMIPFAAGKSAYTFGVKQLSSKRIGEDLQADFDMYFTKSRKFTVLTRQDDAAIKAEQAVLADGNTRDDELAKFGRKYGCDNLVVGKIKEFYVAPPTTRTIAASGATYSMIPRAAIELDYRLVDVATSQIRWADHLIIDLTQDEIAESGGDYPTLYRILLGRAIYGIAQMIDPAKIVKRNRNGEFILNQGSATFAEDDYFDAFVLGEEIEDPDTGDILGSDESLVGIIRISRVDEKISYAVPYSGKISDDDIESGVVVRPHRATIEERDAMNAAAEAARKERAKPKAGVKLPFDK